MGLDMYLYKEVYVGANYDHRNVEVNISITVGGKPLPVNPKRVSTIREQVGYWRKSNAIHAWFVRNVQDDVDECQYSYVSLEQLEELLDTVKQVSAHPELSVSILPPQSGFFFGSTDIDEWYMQDLEDTKEILEKVIAEGKAEREQNIYSDYIYHASW